MPEGKKQGHKKKGQKYKSLLVWNLLLKRTDENHAAGIKEIQELLEDYGIEAERHSVSRDIKDLMDLLNKDQNVLMEDRDLLNYEVEYDAQLHGYKVVRRPYEFDDLRLLAECVRASKFISQKQEESLLAAIEGLCSEHQVKELQNEVYLVGRSKTSNRWIMGSMLTINQAIRDNVKISFKYQMLIKVLQFSHTSEEAAVFAADNCGVDWYEQAARCVQIYLEHNNFSRDELIDKLEAEGFTHEQAVYGVDQNGL